LVHTINHKQTQNTQVGKQQEKECYETRDGIMTQGSRVLYYELSIRCNLLMKHRERFSERQKANSSFMTMNATPARPAPSSQDKGRVILLLSGYNRVN